MRITESKLRKVIRQVILESDTMEDLNDPELFSDFIDAAKERGFDPEALASVNEKFSRRNKLIKESISYKNWGQYLKELENKNINLDAKFNSLSREEKVRVRRQAKAIKRAKGRLKDEKIRELLQFLGYSALTVSMLGGLIAVLCGGWALVPVAIAVKIMSVIGGKSLLSLFGIGLSSIYGTDDLGYGRKKIRQDRESAFDSESPLSDDYLEDIE